MLYIDIHKISYDTCFSTVCLVRKQFHYLLQALTHPVGLRHRIYGLSMLHLKAICTTRVRVISRGCRAINSSMNDSLTFIFGMNFINNSRPVLSDASFPQESKRDL